MNKSQEGEVPAIQKGTCRIHCPNRDAAENGKGANTRCSGTAGLNEALPEKP